MWRTIKMTFWVFVSGAAAGGYGVYQYVHVPFQASIIDRGYCGQRDPFGTAFRYPCRDSAVAMELTQRAMEQDQQTAAILADMEKPTSKAKAKRK